MTLSSSRHVGLSAPRYLKSLANMTEKMPKLYKNFPAGCTDKEIKTAIADYANEITKNRAETNVILQCAPLVQLGLGELQGRFAKRTMIVSILIAVFSLVTSAIAVYLSIKTMELTQDQINQSTEDARNFFRTGK